MGDDLFDHGELGTEYRERRCELLRNQRLSPPKDPTSHTRPTPVVVLKVLKLVNLLQDHEPPKNLSSMHDSINCFARKFSDVIIELRTVH